MGVVGRVLGVPLVAKLIGANVMIVGVAIAVNAIAFSGRGRAEIIGVLIALTIASVVNFLLVRLALRPVEDMQVLAQRVSDGEFGARVSKSPYADAKLARLASTVNGLLDALGAERKRIQDLGAEVIYAQDAERSRVSEELHDSIAQTLAAIRFQLAAARVEADGDLGNRIAMANELLGAVMDQVKNVSYSLHPRVAADLGLESALDALAKQVSARSGVDVRVMCSLSGPPVPVNVRATLFRVAQEALRNIEMHSRAKKASVEVTGREGNICIAIIDDGCGFDAASVKPGQQKSVLASVRDRVMLAGGVMNIESVPNGGTRVTAELQTKRAAS